MITCPKYIPTSYMGQPRDSCMRCGMTLAAHKKLEMQLHPLDAANKWLEEHGYKNHQLHDMFVNIIAEYISTK